MQLSEKQFNTKATTDAFDEIYTNFDLSVNENYNKDNGYPFDYPTRWLNDPSMNKRIAIRRLDAIPSSHGFIIALEAEVNEANLNTFKKSINVDITEHDNLIKVLNYLCNEFSYNVSDYSETDTGTGGLVYEYKNSSNELRLVFKDSMGNPVNFSITDDRSNPMLDPDYQLEQFLEFLNQPKQTELLDLLKNRNTTKLFENVWNRDRLYFHASFSTSRRHFIGKRGDFFQNLSLLYPPPSNESTFFIRFTSNGTKNILLRYCEFDVQLCFIVNFKKANIL